MNLNSVYNDMKLWDSLRRDPDVIKKLFREGNSLSFTMSEHLAGDFIHAYPAVKTNRKAELKLHFYLIGCNYDTRDAFESKKLKTLNCLVQNIGFPKEMLTSYLSYEEAKALVDDWVKHSEKWIEEQCNSEYGMFSAFSIPSTPFSGTDLHLDAFFSLKPDSAEIAGLKSYAADLVLYDKADRQLVAYHDTVRPVPPFGQKKQGTDKEAFYLLKLAGLLK